MLVSVWSLSYMTLMTVSDRDDTDELPRRS